MSDNTQMGSSTDVIATDDLTTLNSGAVSGVKVQRVKVGFGVDGTFTDVGSTNPLPVAFPSAQAVTGTFWQATQPVSGTFWQATQPVSGTFWQATQPVSLATNTPDVTDRAGRLLGQVTNAGTFAVQAAQGAPGSLSNAWPSKITDGTTAAAVKAASTAAVAADPALVVAVSPNAAVRVQDFERIVTGTITAADSTGGAIVLSGSPGIVTPSAGSFVAMQLAGGETTCAITLKTAYGGGSFYVERSNTSTDGSNGTWVACYGRLAGLSITSDTDVYQFGGMGTILFNVAGAKWVRVRNVFGSFGTGSTDVEGAFSSQAPSIVTLKGYVKLDATYNTVKLDQTTPGSTNAVAIDQTSVGTTNRVVDYTQLDTNFSTANTTALNSNVASPTGTGWFDTWQGSYAARYRHVGLHLVPAAGTVTAGAITFEQSDDGNNPVACPMFDDAAPAAAAVTSYTIAAATGRMFNAQLKHRYFRARISTGITGTSAGVSASVTYSVVPFAPTGALQAGSAAIGSVTVASGTVTTVSSITAGNVTTTPVTPTAHTLSSAATTNATVVKASAGTIYSITLSNVGAAAAFFKLFNLAAAPTVGTSVPELTIPIPASGMVNVPLGETGFRNGTGIAYSITNLVADSDATAVAAAQVKVMIAYI